MIKIIYRLAGKLIRRAAGTNDLRYAIRELQQQAQAQTAQWRDMQNEQEVLAARVASMLEPSVSHQYQKQLHAGQSPSLHLDTAAAHEAALAICAPAPGERIRVVFVLQHPSVWSSWRSVIRACMSDARFEPQVILTPFNHPNGGLSAYDAARDLLIREGIPFFSAGHVDISMTRPHVVFLQNPYDETRPSDLRSTSLVAIGCRVAYIPYGLEIGGGAANLRWQYDLDLQRVAWRIYARSDRQRQMFARYCASGNGHVRVTGHPKLDTVSTTATPWIDQLRDKAAGRPVLLWTPHFSVGAGAGWSTFEHYGKTIIDYISERPDLFLLVRPHPMFFSNMLLKELWTADQEAEFKERLRTAENMALDEQHDYEGSFTVASALMADAGSFLLEFMPTGKPIVYLHRSDGPGLSEEGAVTENYIIVRSACELPDVIDSLGRGQDTKREKRLASLEEFLHVQDGKAGERIIQDIAVALGQGSMTYLRPKEHHDASRASKEYWLSATNSYLTEQSYYERKARTLSHWLEQARPCGNLLDIGCSDGQYTAQASPFFASAIGCDLSPALIERANARTDIAPGCNAKFFVADLDSLNIVEKYDCVFCMGVTSCLPSDVAFLRLLDNLAMVTQSGGHLVLVDTVSLSSTVRVCGDDGYVGTYRQEDEYLCSIARRGFTCVYVEELSIDTTRKLVNRFRVYRKDDA